jgi:hypothetical protein
MGYGFGLELELGLGLWVMGFRVGLGSGLGVSLRVRVRGSALSTCRSVRLPRWGSLPSSSREARMARPSLPIDV